MYILVRTFAEAVKKATVQRIPTVTYPCSITEV